MGLFTDKRLRLTMRNHLTNTAYAVVKVKLPPPLFFLELSSGVEGKFRALLRTDGEKSKDMFKGHGAMAQR